MCLGSAVARFRAAPEHAFSMPGMRTVLAGTDRTTISTKLRELTNGNSAGAFLDYFRCPTEFARFTVKCAAATVQGFFRFGPAVCFGNIAEGVTSERVKPDLCDVLPYAEPGTAGDLRLPFDPTEVANNLRLERYVVRVSHELLLQNFYYFLRPLLPLAVRKTLQRRVSRLRRDGSFPAWPVDCSVEQLFQQLMTLVLEASGSSEIPFIWFWPEGCESAMMMTHDVEKEKGARHCDALMDLDDAYGIKAAFQLVPERAYRDFGSLVSKIRARGFEVNIHDLDHDGRLYDHKELFQERARKINEYARQCGTAGFRAGSMHRNQNWFDLLEFQYDMSVPNVSHLEPQRGGCCTVTPYFVGSLLELPLTTVQDHGLFYILGEYSIDLWKQQVETISAHNGLISFIIHPDYIVQARERSLYRELLQYLARLRDRRNVWFALPAEINLWWRARSEMQLVQKGESWHIRGRESERARLAFARMSDGELEYQVVEP
jgi:hypothetical protein